MKLLEVKDKIDKYFDEISPDELIKVIEKYSGKIIEVNPVVKLSHMILIDQCDNSSKCKVLKCYLKINYQNKSYFNTFIFFPHELSDLREMNITPDILASQMISLLISPLNINEGELKTISSDFILFVQELNKKIKQLYK